MEDYQIVELYFQRNADAIKETDSRYGSYCFAIRKVLTIFYVLGYLVSEYQNKTLAWILPLVMIVVLVRLMWILFKIEPV